MIAFIKNYILLQPVQRNPTQSKQAAILILN